MWASRRRKHLIKWARQDSSLELNLASTLVDIVLAELINDIARVISQNSDRLGNADRNCGAPGHPDTDGFERRSKIGRHPLAALGVVGIVHSRACG